MVLFKNEQLVFKHHDGLDGRKIRNSAIDEKYVKGEVRIVTEQARYPLPQIVPMLESANYELNPEFQRRHRWGLEKKSRLIESFIMNVPIPPIFLYEDRYSHYEVMDGLQRLTAISDFYRGRFALEGLVEWPELNGRTYLQLPEQVRRGIDRRYLSSIILLQETAKNEYEAERLKQLVFERINSGGVSLAPQEARNAVYNGPLNQLCIRLARNAHLCRTWGIPEPKKNELDASDVPSRVMNNELFRRMDDVELVLRFFAYRQRRGLQKGSFKEYLDNYLKYGNAFPKVVLSQLEELFSETIALAYDTFGEGVFWLWRNRNDSWNWFRRPTTAVYDPLMFALSQYIENGNQIRARKDEFKRKLTGFYQKNYESFEGRNTNPAILEKRDDLFTEFVENNLAR